MSPSNTVKEREGRKKNVKIDQGRTPISQEPYEAEQMSPGPLMSPNVSVKIFQMLLTF